MAKLIRIAENLFQVACQHPISDADVTEIIDFIRSNANCPRDLEVNVDYQLMHEFMASQPQMPAILEKWRPEFSSPDSLTEAQATEFLRTLLSAVESMGTLLDYDFYAGVTSARAHQWNDIHTYQPFPKQGWNLHLTTEGIGHYNCLRNHLVTTPGDVVLFSPTAFFDYQRSSEADVWTHRWIIFPTEPGWSDLLHWTEVGAGIYHTRVDSDTERSHLIALFEEIRQRSGVMTPLAQRLRRNLTEQILLRCYENHIAHNPAIVDDRVLNAIRFMEDNFHLDLSIEEISEQVHLSSSRLTKLFRQFTGVTPIKWRVEKRMARASQMLTHSLDPINIIAEKVGYPDPLYFTRCFRQQFDCSPREYRKKYLYEESV